MANYLGNFEKGAYDFSIEITEEVFLQHILEDVIPQKCLTGEHTFFYYSGEENLPLEEANEFYIYNSGQGFLYKFSKL
jgi:hypothetical protein